MRIACITGGTSGIGKQITLDLVQSGYHVYAIGKNYQHAQELRDHQIDQVTVIEGDVTNPLFCASLKEKIENQFGRLDVLINGAGTISSGGIGVETYEVWDNVISTNLTSAFVCTKSLLDLLKKSDYPSIVNISSVCSIRTCASLSYSVSKAGLDMFTKVLAKELGTYRIRVNAINPGVVRSNLQFSAGLFDEENKYNEWMNNMKQFHPLGRTGTPDDIAGLIKFLVSKEASWITGAIISIDGGRSVL